VTAQFIPEQEAMHLGGKQKVESGLGGSRGLQWGFSVVDKSD
jgi:hypothetical protein